VSSLSGSGDPSALHAARTALLVALTGVCAILAASVDPWMLVMLAGLAVTVLVLGKQPPMAGFDPVWDQI
jgi:hypothetical protein